MADLSAAQQDCLLAIHALEAQGKVATTSGLATSLQVTAPSVTAMLKRLSSAGLIRHRPYRDVTLSPMGRRAARSVLRRHRLLETFLVQILKFRWDQVHAQADGLEHVVSQRFIDRLDQLLGHPEVDPHGDPIPSPAGRVTKQSETTLADLGNGQRATIAQMADEEPRFLRYAKSVGLVPGASVLLIQRGPFNNPLEVSVQGTLRQLSASLARRILVRQEHSNSGFRKSRASAPASASHSRATAH
ncbi:MAG: metal-dependent transcriptional regulator [Anaerolineales bacterium]|jgi:DtxR family Mn-dependent transcriptional regulator